MSPQAHLSQALANAAEAAHALNDTEDGGTCNFDTCTIFGVRDPAMRKAAEEAGVDVTQTKWLGRKCHWLFLPCSGQGNRRTRMAEAAANVMKAAGFDACVWYQMD